MNIFSARACRGKQHSLSVSVSLVSLLSRTHNISLSLAHARQIDDGPLRVWGPLPCANVGIFDKPVDDAIDSQPSDIREGTERVARGKASRTLTRRDIFRRQKKRLAFNADGSAVERRFASVESSH